MKSSLRIFLISFLAASSLIVFSCGGNDPHHSGDDAHGVIIAPNHKLVTMRVAQIHCGDCKGKVEGVLNNEVGIVRFDVFKAAERSQNVLIVYDPQKIQLDAIKEVITKLGYAVENMTEN